MMLAAGLGPVGYAFAIFHLLTHGFFKADLFLGAGSVMHGMNDEVDMRRYGGAAHGHADHLRHVRPRLPRDHRRPAVLRLLHQGQDHRGGVRPGGAWVVGLVALLGAGITAFYMTRMVVMTFFGEQRWADDAHPHESPEVDDRPADRPGARLGRSRRRARPRTSAIVDWLEPGRRRRRGGAPRSSPARADRVITLVVVVAVGVGARLADVRPRAGAGASRRPGRPLTGAARRDLYGDAFNEAAVHAPRPVPHPLPGLLRQPGRRRRRQRPRRAARRHCPAASAGCRPASSAPTPCPCSAAPPSLVAALLLVRL